MASRPLARRSFPYLIVAASGFLLAYAVLFVFAFPTEILPDEARLPAVVGLAFDQAAAELGKAGFHAVKAESRYHRSVAQDVVLQQDPPAGSLQKRGIDVMLAVSGGQRSATVPEVVGLTRQQARLAIENSGLQLGSVSEISSDLPRGAVVETRPAAGAVVQLPATVSIVLSEGPSAMMVPELTGRSLADARSTLEQLGLTLGTLTRDTSSLQPENTVLSQSPQGGATVSAGASVDLRVSRFPPPLRLPPLDTIPRVQQSPNVELAPE